MTREDKSQDKKSEKKKEETLSKRKRQIGYLQGHTILDELRVR